MLNLIQVELYKLRKFQLGYVAILFMVVMGYLFGDNRIGNKVFEMSDTTTIAFSNAVGDTSFVFLISIVTALYIGKDFSNRTICNEIKLGHSRFHILLSKTIMVCGFAVFLHSIYVLSTVIGFSVVRGFDTSILCIENLYWFLTVLLQLIAITSGIVLISFISRKVSEAIALSALFTVVCCNILRNFITSKIYTLSCFYFVQNSEVETLTFASMSACITIILFLAIARYSFHKADIR